MQEILEALGLDQAQQHALFEFRGKRPAVGLRLHTILQPTLFLRVLDMHVLATQASAIGLAQGVENHSQRCDAGPAGERTSDELALQIPDGQAVGGRIEFWMILRRCAERI